MKYNFLNNSIDKNNITLIKSKKINPFLLKNNEAEVRKAIDFIASDEKFLYVHGFMGTGKRQFLNYICEYINEDVIKLEYYCKEATVCDDIFLVFTEFVNNLPEAKVINFNSKIATLGVKFRQQISGIKKPFLIVIHSFDDISEDNIQSVRETLSLIAKEKNIKLIISTRAMNPSILGDLEQDRKIFLKALTKEIFKEYIEDKQLKVTDTTIDDFYRYTRGYYYYLALSIKIMQAMKLNLNEFLYKFNQSEMSFDSYLGATYINIVPTAIRNFFWFLRTVRHGLSLNALAIIEVYDEFAIDYLKKNLMIFQADETVYVHDYFLQKIDLSIPVKTEIKLHKYIIGIYEEQLKTPLKDRAVMISRQAMRAEIEYHNDRITLLEKGEKETQEAIDENTEQEQENYTTTSVNVEISISAKIKHAISLAKNKKYTDAIEAFNVIMSREDIDLASLIESRLHLARIYMEIEDYKMASHLYEIVEIYYIQNKENINLNYLYYELTDLYFKMYKNERAVETIKKVIYSVDTPQSLLVSSCVLLGNIYSAMQNPEDAYAYYKKALESLNSDVDNSVLADLYFKYALANDDKGEQSEAFEYYNKCIAIRGQDYYRSMAYSNLASCYYDNESYDDALACFKKAYNIDESNNNYEGKYYNSSHIAKLLMMRNSEQAFDYLIETQKSAEFLNEEIYILEACTALGDYYYNKPNSHKEALTQYLKAYELAKKHPTDVDISKLEKRIADMKIRMSN